MSKLEKYIENIKNLIEKNPQISELEIMRYIYMDLGKNLDFDLNYTFGNSKEKKKIYEKAVNKDELNRILEMRTSICKGISHLYSHILNELGIETTIVREYNEYLNKVGRHVYNQVKLKDGKRLIVDLEDDLEYIQSGAKTRKFGIDEETNQLIVSDEELREMDMKNGYIPEGYYLEDMVYLLKIAVDNDHISLENKLEFVLDNLNAYRDTKNVKYREMIRYQERMFEEMFDPNELRKIHLINTYEDIEGKRNYKSCIVLDNKEQQSVYLYNNEKYKYNKITMDELLNNIENGLVAMDGIPGMKKYLRSRKEQGSTER